VSAPEQQSKSFTIANEYGSRTPPLRREGETFDIKVTQRSVDASLNELQEETSIIEN
jgi:hypothetical protein